MKIIALLLSIYLTALSVVPCTDSMTSCTSHSGIELSIDEHDHDHSDHQDGCTPFCVCACCGSLVILPTIQKMGDPKAKISTDLLFDYSFAYSFEYSEGVWHPPIYS